MSLSKELGAKSVRRNAKYNIVINLLVHGRLGSDAADLVEPARAAPVSRDKIFPYIKDLIIFAAMVGKRYEMQEEVIASESISISLNTFEGASTSNRDSLIHQHNVIFMFGISILRDMKYLRDENIDEVISVFERYSNGGLSKINDWLVESGYNPLVLLEKIVDELHDQRGSDIPEIINPF